MATGKITSRKGIFNRGWTRINMDANPPRQMPPANSALQNPQYNDESSRSFSKEFGARLSQPQPARRPRNVPLEKPAPLRHRKSCGWDSRAPVVAAQAALGLSVPIRG